MICLVSVLYLSCSLASAVSSTTEELRVDQTESSLKEMIRETCLLKTGYKLMDNSSFCRILEIQDQETAYLPCSYCGESTEDLPKIWTKKSRDANTTVTEVEIGLSPKLEENRIVEFPNHTLAIFNVSLNDTGMYVCKSLLEEDASEFKFNLEVVKTEIPVVKMEKIDWNKYEHDYIEKANENIYNSKDKSTSDLLDKVKAKIVGEWDPWLPCDGCAGIRRRYAKCRLRASLNRLKYSDIIEENLSEDQKAVHEAHVISCHSLFLNQSYPQLYSITFLVPNLLETQKCVDSCSEANRLGHEPRYQLVLRMDVGSSMSFACPESNMKSKVIWRKDGSLLKQVGPRKINKKKKKQSFLKSKNPFKKKAEEFEVERAFVDRINVLQLCSVTFKETGVYVCYVDKRVIKSFNITVVTAEEVQKERYYHFWLLSLYSSAISTTIVLMAIVWAFFTRDSFYKVLEE